MVEIFSRKMAQSIDDPEELEDRKDQLIEMIEPYIDIYKVAGRALIDEVIDPRETRDYIANGLDLARDKHVERPWRKSGVRPV
jgi:acetyl-CoA carboxylase carboxyltransferase component